MISIGKKTQLYMKLFCTILCFQSMAFASNSDTQTLRNAVTVDNIRAHQQALQLISDQYGGNRMASSRGYGKSVAYVYGQMVGAKYNVHVQDFEIHLSEERTPPTLQKTSPGQQTFVANVDFATMTKEGIATIEGEVEAVDLVIPSPEPNHSTSGCDKDDWKNFKPGNIALIQRGTCTFVSKVELAVQAGASGAIIFNEGNPGRTGVVTSKLSPKAPNFPVLGATFEVGEKLRNAFLKGPTGVRARITIDAQLIPHTVQNVIAESKEGDPSRVMVIGAHLDSVEDGPGLNDNGSGSATILEIAKQIQKLPSPPKNKLRFIWFAAEEFGLLGSAFYVNSLTPEQRNQIQAMLNFDMLGSSNYVRFVYDGDESSKAELRAQAAPAGSAKLEKIFLDYFQESGLASHPTGFNGRSDYGSFIEHQIPAGGLFSGAEGIKSRELARIYGGKANEPFDPCYHQSCDDFSHTGGSPDYALAVKSLDELADAAAHAVLLVANIEERIRPLKPSKTFKVDFEYRGNLMLK